MDESERELALICCKTAAGIRMLRHGATKIRGTMPLRIIQSAALIRFRYRKRPGASL
jgi:hypothetical protein